ncbi:NAD(P)-dependent oxidoreductase [Streptomyces sp. 6N223]|uniref:NAD(P)-dependent oxidoreductase n=1 Tax=Streptomyces sp. 6N223 TaxID=3457412 RepID=UPI003FD03F82
MTTHTKTNTTANVTVIGLGAMGSALAGALLDAGHRVMVWNRTPSRADPLVARGAARAETAAEAVAASELTVVCLVDYAASRQVLEPAAGALSGRTLVNLTSDTPERAREAAGWAREHGIDYLDGAVMVPVPVVGTPEALLLYSGGQAAFARHEATLRALGGNARYLGEDPGAAALHDLALLDIFWTMMTAVLHAFALVGADGVRASEFAPLAVESITGLAPLLVEEAAAVDAGRHPGELAPLATDAEGVAHVAEASRVRGLDTSVIEAVHALMARTIAAGHGNDGFSRVIDAIQDRLPSGLPSATRAAASEAASGAPAGRRG